MVAARIVEKAMNDGIFEVWKDQIAPTLLPVEVVIPKDVAFHKNKRAAE